VARKKAFRSNKDLYDFHQLGKYVIGVTSPAADEFEKGSLSELCLLTKKSANELSKARQFAQQYSDSQLKKLCTLGQTKGRPLTKSHICRLVVVRDYKERDRLAEACANGSWSVAQLEREIRKIQPKSGHGGRQPKVPKTLDKLLGEAETMVSRWSNFCRVVRDFHDSDRARTARQKTLPAGIEHRLGEVATLLRELQREIKLKMERLEKRRTKHSRTKLL
jgi:hypothetical protein